MEKIKTKRVIPSKVYNEILDYFKNFEQIDSEIKKRRDYLLNDGFDYYHFTNKNSLKNLKTFGYTLDNCIIALDEDWLINKHQTIKKIIINYRNELDNTNDYIKYWIIEYLLLGDKDEVFVCEHLNLEMKELKHEIFLIVYEIYQRGIEAEIYEEVKSSVRV